LAVLGPSTSRVTVAELAVVGIVRLGVVLDNDPRAVVSVRLVALLFCGSATEVAVKVTVTGVAADAAGYTAGAV